MTEIKGWHPYRYTNIDVDEGASEAGPPPTAAGWAAVIGAVLECAECKLCVADRAYLAAMVKAARAAPEGNGG